MDQSLEQYNQEYVKKVMLEQEETFKHQVLELHRLYQVQRILMAELNDKFRQTYSTESTADRKLNECDIDLTLSIGCSASKRSSKS
ncbi:hypothetical protein J5N97_002560 [Dioscorea zingiberensis]|uniref:Uncharacterized protein n=1 Tax=Dioscorea zingiberensis TaxID=325984 RepID=A0A9D5D456_9LILI|nr:hypothetical protein J5N97_002560 [Dioscorea zingiberensis]